jgi:ATP-dependent Lhr-like helicase
LKRSVRAIPATRIGFHPIVRQWLETQFAAPSPPQIQGWPSIAKGKHTLILAPTGSGKTLAAFLWSIDQLFRQSLAADTRGFLKNADGVHTLYISPLKALNNDIQRTLAICSLNPPRNSGFFGKSF